MTDDTAFLGRINAFDLYRCAFAPYSWWLLGELQAVVRKVES